MKARKLKNLHIILLLSLACANTMFSCSKKRASDEIYTGEPGELIIGSVSVEESIVGNFSRGGQRADGVGRSLVSVPSSKQEEWISTGDFDVLLTSGNNELTADLVNGNAQRAGVGRSEQRASTALPSSAPEDMRYTLLIYELSDCTPGATRVARVHYDTDHSFGQSSRIVLVPGKCYEWFAKSAEAPYTQNLSPELISETYDVLNTELGVNFGPSVTTNSVSDVLFDSGKITISGTQTNLLNINFKQQMARVDIILNTRGLFGAIDEGADGATISFQAPNTNTFDFLTSSFTSIGTLENEPRNKTVNNGGLHQIELNDTYHDPDDAYTGDGVQRGTYYMPPGVNLGATDLVVTLQNLRVRLDDNSTRTYATATSTLTIPNSANTVLEAGHRYVIHLRMVEPALQMNSSYGTVASQTAWARTNLIYDATKPDSYRFRPNNNYGYNAANPPTSEQMNEFWKPYALIPNGTSDYTELPDPCLLVYPRGVWSSAPIKAIVKDDYQLEVDNWYANLRTFPYKMHLPDFVTAGNRAYSAYTIETMNTAFPNDGEGLVFNHVGFYGYSGDFFIGHDASGSGNSTFANTLRGTPFLADGDWQYPFMQRSLGETSDNVNILNMSQSMLESQNLWFPIRCVRTASVQ